MPVYRGPDGKIIEEKTNKLEDVTQSTDKAQRPLPPTPSGSGQAAGAGRLDAPTQKMDTSGSSSNAITEEKTRVVGGRRRQEDQQRLEERAEKAEGMDDPVVGWLVIVEGPGKGRAMQLVMVLIPLAAGRLTASISILVMIKFRVADMLS